MSKNKSLSVLITGASGGIGKATGLYLARRGHRVVATGRSITRLGEIQEDAKAEGLPLTTFELDVNDPESVSSQAQLILEEMGPVDVLVNNAGYGLVGCLEELEVDEVKDLFETNVFAILRMTQAVLPHMRDRGSGTIINVGSVTGNIGTPLGGAYAASKSALKMLSAVQRLEVERFGVRVALIEPGLYRSNFHRDQVVGRRVGEEGSHYGNYTEGIYRGTRRFHLRAKDPAAVAKTVEKIMLARHPHARYQVGIEAWLGAIGPRLLPDGVVEFFVKRVISG